MFPGWKDYGIVLDSPWFWTTPIDPIMIPGGFHGAFQSASHQVGLAPGTADSLLGPAEGSETCGLHGPGGWPPGTHGDAGVWKTIEKWWDFKIHQHTSAMNSWILMDIDGWIIFVGLVCLKKLKIGYCTHNSTGIYGHVSNEASIFCGIFADTPRNLSHPLNHPAIRLLLIGWPMVNSGGPTLWNMRMKQPSLEYTKHMDGYQKSLISRLIRKLRWNNKCRGSSCQTGYMCCKLCWYVEWLYGTLKMMCFGDATDQNDGFGLKLGVPMGLFPAREQFLKADLQKMSSP